MSDKRQVVATCYHCGNKGLMNIIGSFTQEENECDIYGRRLGNPYESNEWILLQCPVCNLPTLYCEDNLLREYCADSVVIGEVFYPTNNIDNLYVPKEIRSAFESANRTLGIDSAVCLLSLRRTLEMICKQKGIVEGTLENKIKQLVIQHQLPQIMDDICYIIRKAGNDGAHADSINLHESEIREIIQYLAITINYLYSMPKRVELLKEKIDRKSVTDKEKLS
jgi:hypothetical protein